MKKVLLCILDGVGISKTEYGNAFYHAHKPCLDKLMKSYPHSVLEASGENVGLPAGQMGNSEVGHTNIGAGRVVYQPQSLITSKIEDKSFFDNDRLLEVINHVKNNHSKLHIMGLVSDGGIHSRMHHIYALLQMCKQYGVDRVYVHAFTDGRDTSPYSGEKYIRALEEKMQELNIGKIATVSGRYYAMDRDNNYDRVQLAYQTIVNGEGKHYKTALEAWGDSQQNNITDEFIVPVVIAKEGIVEKHDGIIYANFRPDRIRELGSSLTNPNFTGFSREFLEDIQMVTLMPVSEEVISTPAFRLEELVATLGEYISQKGLTQLRIAETEKYAHVTYFFDGGVEKDLVGAKRILIPSPKVATYDLKPEMSAYEITDTLLVEIKKNHPDLIVLNFANGDMVGHTGNYEAAIKAVETLDLCLKKIVSKIKLEEYEVLITADHGNCEVMLNRDGSVNTQHTTNVVPFLVLNKKIKLKDGKLGDVAVTILDLMGIDIPEKMTGNSLLVKESK